MKLGTRKDIPGLVCRTYGLDLHLFLKQLWQYRGGGMNP